MSPITIANIAFGGGRTRICVPLTAGSLPELGEELKAAAALPADLYEWRADYFLGDWASALALLKEQAGRPVLATLRTKGQGGEWEGGPEAYEEAVLRLAGSGAPAMVDVELAWGEERARRLIEAAHAQGMGAVASHHDFAATPSQEDMLALLTRMKALGADLPKLAVMPRCPQEVLALLHVTWQAAERLGPVVTMSMGPLGRLSRVSGGLTGSCLSFAAGLRPSAPGQIGAAELRRILDALEGEA